MLLSTRVAEKKAGKTIPSLSAFKRNSTRHPGQNDVVLWSSRSLSHITQFC